ncbi:hypothetical protein [Streptomyces katsurahamanus]|uniref:CynX/NimT family MFS transporter n=1 Tax=Streptomyces katsurahamanus TaxID=2577098 RepID=A0ABW9NSS6_9ACTN|nr:hypothetical protein [Streptomyces katsurahamanus]MQS36206.1 CynX/NimT family MFS transporter [Streptomyces katsurahamanus]
MSKEIKRRLGRALAVGSTLLMAGGGLLATAAPASAEPRDGNVEVGEIGLRFSSYEERPVLDLYSDDNNLSDDKFPGTQTRADNNTELVWNRDVFTWQLCTEADYSGPCTSISPGYSVNLVAPFRNTVSSARYGFF